MTPQLLEIRGASTERERIVRRERNRKLEQRTRHLLWLNLAWISVAAVLAVLAGALAGSVSLVGFGVASAIEACAGAVAIWHLAGSRLPRERGGQVARRAVAIQFLLLAPFLGFVSILGFLHGDEAATSLLGITVALASIVAMPELGVAKRRIAAISGPAASDEEGPPDMFGYLAGALLLGLLSNAVFGLWWIDPLVGLLIAAAALRQGVLAWPGGGERR